MNARLQAQLIQGRLESEGIPCSIENRVRVHVLEEDLSRARKLLDDLGSSEPDESDSVLDSR